MTLLWTGLAALCLAYAGVAMLAAFSAPWLTLALVGTTFYCTRVDEPRVLTLLCPFAAIAVLGAL